MVRDEKGGLKTVEDYISDPTDFSGLGGSRDEFIRSKTTVRFEGPNVIYMVMLVNVEKRPIYDILLKVNAPESLLTTTPSVKIPRLLPGKPEVVKITLRPTHVCGTVEISSELQFVNPRTDHVRNEEVPAVDLSIDAPIVYPRPVDTNEWMSTAKALINTAERIAIPLPANAILDKLTETLKGVNMYALEPNIAESPSGLRAKLRFYCESVSEKYATYIELMGEGGKTKLILRSFAQDKKLLIGYHHAVLDELDESLAIKQFIMDPLVKTNIDSYKRPPPKGLIEAAQYGGGHALPSPSQYGAGPAPGYAQGGPGAAAGPMGGGSGPGGTEARGSSMIGGSSAGAKAIGPVGSGEAAFSTKPSDGPKQEEFLIRCYKCQRKMIVRVRERPAVIQCPYCGAKAMIE